MILHQEDGPRLGQLTKIMTLDWIIHKLQTQSQDAWQHE
jgi:lysyl-tRNA synthetase class I